MNLEVRHSLGGREYAKWAGLLLAWMCVIFFSSTSLAGRESDGAFSGFFSAHLRRFDTEDLYHRWHLHFFAEKSVHLCMFLVFALLLWRLLPAIRGKVLVVFASGALLGCCSEVAQSFFPGRDPAVRDVLINMAGTAIGTAISRFRARVQRKIVRAELSTERVRS